jgi:hypothetical protein
MGPKTAAPAILVSGLALSFLGAGCSPASPTPVSRFELAGPESVQPGESVQYRAIEHLAHGSIRPPADVRWSSSAPGVLQISSTGLATGGAAGESVLTAEAGDQRATRPILVLPAGTFRLSGTIHETTSKAPVPGARVEAEIYEGERMQSVPVATAGSDGKYSLYGIPGFPRGAFIRVTQAGYFPATELVNTLRAHGTLDLSIERIDTSLPDLAGSYTLTIEADAACPSAPSPLPPHLRRRTFGAQMQQTGQRLIVSVSSPCVGHFDEGCEFTGRASTSGATFQLTEGDQSRGYYTAPDLVEGLATFVPDPQGLWFLGVAMTNISAAGLSGSLAGQITYHPNVFPFPGPSTAGCGAGRFELTRR